MTDSNEPPRGTQSDIERIRRQRSIVTAVLLGAFVVLLFAISIVKFGAQ